MRTFLALCTCVLLVIATMNPFGTNPVKRNDVSCEETLDDIDWTPKGFKEKCPDEWRGVNGAINEQQKEQTDYGRIDASVREYIAKKKIKLPDAIKDEIKAIKNLCETKFNIEDYDDSNMGMHIADGTARTFDRYILWLYEQAVKDHAAIIARTIDWEMEKVMFSKLMKSMYDVCDSVAHCMDGSLSWTAWAYIDWLELNHQKDMLRLMIGDDVDKREVFHATEQMIKDECLLMINNYDLDTIWYNTPMDRVAPIINNFEDSFLTWINHRKSIAKRLDDSAFKDNYEMITYGYVRQLFINLKNRFNDVGPCSNDMDEVMIDETCSNQELMEYSFEKAWEEHLKQFSLPSRNGIDERITLNNNLE